jgi:hypothetical protein
MEIELAIGLRDEGYGVWGDDCAAVIGRRMSVRIVEAKKSASVLWAISRGPARKRGTCLVHPCHARDSTGLRLRLLAFQLGVVLSHEPADLVGEVE